MDCIPSQIIGIASGVSYLLSKNIYCIRSQCESVLVSSTGHPVICDFNNEVHGICEDDIGIRWMAPELFSDSLYRDINQIYIPTRSRPTVESNVWALGMTLDELLSGTVPYSWIRSGLRMWNVTWEEEVRGEITNGVLPNSQFDTCSANGEALRAICCKCWIRDPKARPSVEHVLQELELLNATTTTASANIGATSERDQVERQTLPSASVLKRRSSLDSFDETSAGDVKRPRLDVLPVTQASNQL